MALARCFECDREISSTAMTCPHCGFSYKPKVTVFGVVLRIVAAIVVLAVLCVSGCVFIVRA